MPDSSNSAKSEITSGKHVHVMNTPLYPTFISTGVYRGIYIFLIVAPKHRLWVFVTTGPHNLCFWQK